MKFFANVKEFFRKLIVSLKRKPQTFALLMLLVAFVYYSLNLTHISNTTAYIQGVGMGLSAFVVMLFSVLGMVCFLNAFPHRKKVNIPMLVLLFVMLGAVLGCSMYYESTIDKAYADWNAQYLEQNLNKGKDSVLKAQTSVQQAEEYLATAQEKKQEVDAAAAEVASLAEEINTLAEELAAERAAAEAAAQLAAEEAAAQLAAEEAAAQLAAEEAAAQLAAEEAAEEAMEEESAENSEAEELPEEPVTEEPAEEEAAEEPAAQEPTAEEIAEAPVTEEPAEEEAAEEPVAQEPTAEEIAAAEAAAAAAAARAQAIDDAARLTSKAVSNANKAAKNANEQLGKIETALGKATAGLQEINVALGYAEGDGEAAAPMMLDDLEKKASAVATQNNNARKAANNVNNQLNNALEEVEKLTNALARIHGTEQAEEETTAAEAPAGAAQETTEPDRASVVLPDYLVAEAEARRDASFAKRVSEHAFIEKALDILLCHRILLGVSVVLLALLPVYAPLIRKINTSVEVEENADMGQIELDNTDD